MNTHAENTDRAIRGHPWSDKSPLVQHSLMPSQAAQLAIRLAEHLSFATGFPDGEDSVGRQKLRLLTAIEVAERACKIAQAMWDQFDARGWLLALPEESPEEESK